MFRLIKMVPK